MTKTEPLLNKAQDPSSETVEVMVEYKVSAVLFTVFSLCFYLLFNLVTAAIFILIAYFGYFHRESLSTTEVSIQLALATFIDNLLLVLVTAPIIYLGARAGRVSFLEPIALTIGFFKYLPLRIPNVFLRALAMATVAEVCLACPAILIFWSVCWADIAKCSYRAQYVGILGFVWLIVQNAIFFPLVFAAGLNKTMVSKETLHIGIKNASKRSAMMKNSRSALSKSTR